MNKFKVIKDFGSVLKGDTFTYDDNSELYICDVRGDNFSRFMAIDENTLKAFLNKGFVMEVNAKKDKCDCIKVKDCVKFIDDLLEQYESDLKATLDKFNKGEIQPCVKVEAETVYYNLTKVLNAIKDKLTNE